MRDSEKGFIALISAIVISVLLLVITLTLGMTSFFARFNVLDSEFKEQSTALAESCVSQAMLDLAQGTSSSKSYPLRVDVGSDHCFIPNQPVVSGTQTTIKATANIQGAATNIEAVVKNADWSVVSWRECVSAC
jgi:hypothetical protein